MSAAHAPWGDLETFLIMVSGDDARGADRGLAQEDAAHAWVMTESLLCCGVPSLREDVQGRRLEALARLGLGDLSSEGDQASCLWRAHGRAMAGRCRGR